MDVDGRPSSWLLMAVSEGRQHGGNSGYDDLPDVYYTWDSTVPNHAQIRVGDRIVLWDKHRLLGISVIEAIETEVKAKTLFKCPRCERAGIKARTTVSPLYKCYKCGHLFDVPTTHQAIVTEYRSRHDAAWTSLENVIAGADLRLLCERPKSQLSMRPLRWPAFQSTLLEKGADHAVGRVENRAPDFVFPQGFTIELTRVRRGQRNFRERLLTAQGETCALTGEAPVRVLEAGHLYSYGKLGVHYEHGGLLLRRDVHKLFDDGWLAVEPGNNRIDVSPELERFGQYARLHGQPLATRLRKQQESWLEIHWKEHRAS